MNSETLKKIDSIIKLAESRNKTADLVAKPVASVTKIKNKTPQISQKNKDKNILVEGCTVKIVSEGHKYNGELGKIVKVGRNRCYVEISGLKSPLYLFMTDVILA